LRYRLAALEKVYTPSHDELIEEYEISLVLGKFDRAVAALEKNLSLLDSTVAADRISLAEFYYLDGAHSLATTMLNRIESQLSGLPWQWRMKVIVLKAALGGAYEESQRALAALLRLNMEDAGVRLNGELAKLSRARDELQSR
jgi:hypothetical protein